MKLESLEQMLYSADPARAFQRAHESGLLKELLPELDETFGYDQENPHHQLSLGEHLLATLDYLSESSYDLDLRLAGLLHDIGKPRSAWTDSQGIKHYYQKGELGKDHARVGAELARARLREIGMEEERINRIYHLIKEHMKEPKTKDQRLLRSADLKAKCRREMGIETYLRELLSPWPIVAAALYGSYAKAELHEGSDIDVLVIAQNQLTNLDLKKLSEEATHTVGREVNFTCYPASHFLGRGISPYGFLARILSGPLIPLIGDARAMRPPHRSKDWVPRVARDRGIK